jgi:DNA (cytosine-5)-methyltransferase 1
LINYKLINYCEFDKYAAKAYSLIHNELENKNLGDITLINEKEIADFNTMVGGSPCQDFSVAGKQEGSKWTCIDCKHEYNPLEAHYTKRDKCPKCNSNNIEKTRSSLLVEWLRVLREKKPNLAIYENVKNIISKKFKHTFDLFIQELNEYGYNTYYKVLNAKDYNIPQNRERVIVVIIKKDIDNGKFNFPKPLGLNCSMYDFLEDLVDSKYILSDKMFAYVLDLNEKQKGTKWEGRANNDFINPKVAHTLSVRGIKGQRAGVSNIICTTTKNEIKVIDYKTNLQNKTNDKLLRNLTEKECFRLMGFKDNDYEILKQSNIPSGQLYKLTGNSIVVDVLFYILLEIYKAMPYLLEDIKLSSFFSGIGAFEKAIMRLQESINAQNKNAINY